MAKQKFKITNWPTYNKALINRGSITFWLDDEAIQAWYESATPSSRGRPQRYSDLAITTVLVIKRVFRLTLRAAQGFIDSIFSLMNVPLRCPDYSCVSRRAKSVNISFKTPTRYHFIWEGRVHRVGASAGITLIDDNNHQAAEVMSQADIACYASKNGGRGRVTIYEPQQAATHSERAAISLDEQWRMIKENQLMMIAHGVASPRIPEARNLWLISLKLWSCEGEIIDEQTFRRSFSDPALSHALDRRVFHDFFQQAAKAIASKGLSIALPLSVAGLSSATLVNELIEQLENSPLPPRLLHLIIPADAILDHAESVQKLRLAGCRIVFSQVGRDLQIFNSLKANMADYLLLDGELCANVQGNLMDEMLITIIQGHAQRLGMKTIAGPVVLPLVMDTLSGIGVDLIYGDVIADAQPLDLLVNSSYFAIN